MSVPSFSLLSEAGLVESDAFSQSLHDPGSSILTRTELVCRSSGSSGGRTSQQTPPPPPAVEPASAAPHEKVS